MADQTLALLETAHRRFVDDLKAKGRATATILAYGKDIDQFVTYLKNHQKTLVTQVVPQDIEDFKQKLLADQYTPKSVSRKLNSIKTFFRFLKAEGVIDKSPAEKIKHPKYQPKQPRILSKLEYRALRDVCRDDVRIAAIVEVLLQTGLRISELANLNLDDIKNNKLIVRPYESRPGREVPLNKAAQAALNRYLAVRPKTRTKKLFVTKSGKPFLVRNIRNAIKRYFKLADIQDATVNDLRNTFIAHQLKAGTPLIVVSKLVGHKRLTTTEKYLKAIQSRKTNPLPSNEPQEL